MGYKTILTVVTDLAAAKAQLDTAIAVARRQDAHLEILCMGVDRTQTGYYYAGAACTTGHKCPIRASAATTTAITGKTGGCRTRC